MNVFTASKSLIVLEEKPLATPGGEGAVHKIIGSAKYSDHCVKIFHANKRTDKKKAKIGFMIGHEPAISTATPYRFCWPKEIVFDYGGKFIGFIMPVAFPNSEKLYELSTLKLAPRLIPAWRKFDRGTEAGMQNRMKICVNLAAAVNALHACKWYTLVDMKPQNILISPDGRLSVTDIDSFQVVSGLSVYPGDVVTAEYAPAEFYSGKSDGQIVTAGWDHFSLAVAVYEILLGVHPYAASCYDWYPEAGTVGEKIKSGLFVHGANKSFLSIIPRPHEKFHNLPQAIKALFHRAFVDGHHNAAERPSAELWGRTLFGQVPRVVV